MSDISKLGQVGYKVPSEYKPNAGLDYRKILIINDENYIPRSTVNDFKLFLPNFPNEIIQCLLKIEVFLFLIILILVKCVFLSTKVERHALDFPLLETIVSSSQCPISNLFLTSLGL